VGWFVGIELELNRFVHDDGLIDHAARVFENDGDIGFFRSPALLIH
jgi:hypothetical protein